MRGLLVRVGSLLTCGRDLLPAGEAMRRERRDTAEANALRPDAPIDPYNEPDDREPGSSATGSRIQKRKRGYGINRNPLIPLVGAIGFEPTTL
ncbi:hypothetical protein EMIT0111MI5_100214 [Burkholderia sp. IT-111MI5]